MCNLQAMPFARFDRHAVAADLDGGAISSDAGAVLVGGTTKAIGLAVCFAARFCDGRCAGHVVHGLSTIVGQRVFARTRSQT